MANKVVNDDSSGSGTAIPNEQFIIEIFHDWKVLVGMLIFYLFISKPFFVSFRDMISLTPASNGLKMFVFLHNVALAIFSGIVFLYVLPTFVNFLSFHGFKEMMCSKGEFWNATNYGFWTEIFYISKYYEFVDTWILILKGKEPSFLQVYHHTGIVIIMYLGCTSQSNWQIWVVLLNSLIHTLMYTYYAFATMGYKWSGAKYLTSAQLLQFYTGIVLSATTYFYQPGCATRDQIIALVSIHAYAIGLVYLFQQMYKQKYESRSRNTKKK